MYLSYQVSALQIFFHHFPMGLKQLQCEDFINNTEHNAVFFRLIEHLQNISIFKKPLTSDEITVAYPHWKTKVIGRANGCNTVQEEVEITEVESAVKKDSSQDSVKSEDVFIDPLSCSVYSQEKFTAGECLLIEAFVHLSSKRDKVKSTAAEHNHDATERLSKILKQDPSIGSTIYIQLIIGGIEIEDSVQKIRWLGYTDSTQFLVDVPDTFKQRQIKCQLIIRVDNDKPIGSCKFIVTNSNYDHRQSNKSVKHEFKRYEHVFISYASKDREEVLKRVQTYSVHNINYFQDILSLSPGQRYEKEIFENIDASDAFLLFWSKAAKKSSYVLKEAEYALNLNEDQGKPDIIPVIIEGPPLVEPPASLSEIHFNDSLAYLIELERMIGKRKSLLKTIYGWIANLFTLT